MLLGAVLIAAVAPIAIAYGVTLLPPRAEAIEGDKLVPWMITWGLVLLTAGIALAMAVFLGGIAISSGRRS
jgi:hypothetical protein